jgi:formate hydrogenlyase subunit 3/multisubunit Na+/H+ antiporter MnhD subunit
LFTSTWVLFFLRIEGLFMLIVGGLGAAFQRHLGKLMGYAMMVEIGNTVLTMSLGLGGAENRQIQAMVFPQLLPRAVSLAILSLSLHIIRKETGTLSLPEIIRVGRRLPVTSLAFFISILSLVGYPLTAGFPTHLLIWQNLFLQFPLASLVNIFGSVGVMIGGLRGFSALVHGGEESALTGEETRSQVILLGVGVVSIFVLGLIPQIYFPILFEMGLAFLGGG